MNNAIVFLYKEDMFSKLFQLVKGKLYVLVASQPAILSNKNLFY